MALIQTSGLISDISGKIAGSVFQRNQGGLSMRTQRTQRNANTNLQQENKIGISNITATWITLSQSQRDQWNQYAIFRNIKQKRNQSRAINGHQLFIRENNLRWQMRNFGPLFVSPIHTTPLFANPPLNITLDVLINVIAQFRVRTTRALTPATEALLLWISRPIKQSQTSSYIKRKMIKVLTEANDTHIITDYYTQIYSSIPEVNDFVSIEIGLYNDIVKTFTKSPPQLIQVI